MSHKPQSTNNRPTRSQHRLDLVDGCKALYNGTVGRPQAAFRQRRVLLVRRHVVVRGCGRGGVAAGGLPALRGPAPAAAAPPRCCCCCSIVHAVRRLGDALPHARAEAVEPLRPLLPRGLLSVLLRMLLPLLPQRQATAAQNARYKARGEGTWTEGRGWRDGERGWRGADERDGDCVED
jgi:hypothetical protein